MELNAEFAADSAAIDEYQHYCDTPTVETIEAISWWIEPEQQKRYPNLSRMALDYLSIPGMSAEPKRLFSATKHTIEDLRYRIRSDTVEALQCLRSWLKIKDSEFEGLTRWVEEEAKEKDPVV